MYCDVKNSPKHIVMLHCTVAVLSTSLTQLNCGQLQYHVVVNGPIAMHLNDSRPYKFSGRINKHFELD